MSNRYHVLFPNQEHKWYTEEELCQETEKFLRSPKGANQLDAKAVVQHITGGLYTEDVLNAQGLFVIQEAIRKLIKEDKRNDYNYK